MNKVGTDVASRQKNPQHHPDRHGTHGDYDQFDFVPAFHPLPPRGFARSIYTSAYAAAEAGGADSTVMVASASSHPLEPHLPASVQECIVAGITPSPSLNVRGARRKFVSPPMVLQRARR